MIVISCLRISDCPAIYPSVAANASLPRGRGADRPPLRARGAIGYTVCSVDVQIRRRAVLEGMKVVEMASIAAGPVAAAMLAEWGADVIKIEPLDGDRGRYTLTGLGVRDLTINPNVDLHNRGKRSIALSLSEPESYPIIEKLVRWADVFVTNQQPHKLEQRRLDFASLTAFNPSLVYASVTGYGLDGPDREFPGIDHAAFWARSGLAGLMTPKGMEPIPIRMAAGDRVTSLALVSGILAAWIGAQKTGEAKLVETSLLRAGVFVIGTDIGLQIVRGRVGSNKVRHENVNPYHSFYPTKDGRWMAVSMGRAPVAEVLEHPELADDPRFATPASRREHAREVVDILDGIFREKTLAEWIELFRTKEFIWAPVQLPAEVIEDPQAIAAGAFVDVPLNDGSGSYRGPAMAVGFRAADGTPDGVPRCQAPAVGEHTDEVLNLVGYGDADIAALRAKRVVA